MKRAVFVTWCLLAACGGEGDGLVTQGDLCYQTASVYCTRLDMCFGNELPECPGFFVQGCCEMDDTCDVVRRDFTEDKLDDCLNDLSIQPCDDVLDGLIPRSCQ